uniref:Uncharacterized protein n=1 Tax=Anopheles quadriannulatus TaxID=34691 RepID=A0A182XQV8_ANOQN
RTLTLCLFQTEPYAESVVCALVRRSLTPVKCHLAKREVKSGKFFKVQIHTRKKKSAQECVDVCECCYTKNKPLR